MWRVSDQVNLLDMKRSMNVNIFLKQFKMSNEKIVQLVKHGDDQQIGAEKLKGLVKILPDKDEVEQESCAIAKMTARCA